MNKISSTYVTYSDGVGGTLVGQVFLDGGGWWWVFASVFLWPVLPLCHNHPFKNNKTIACQPYDCYDNIMNNITKCPCITLKRNQRKYSCIL